MISSNIWQRNKITTTSSNDQRVLLLTVSWNFCTILMVVKSEIQVIKMSGEPNENSGSSLLANKSYTLK